MCEGIERGLADGSFRNLNTSEEVYLWIDFACIEQDDHAEKIKGIRSLVYYVSKCQTMIIPTRGMDYQQIHLSKDYGERAWCRFESFLFSVISKVRVPSEAVQSFFISSKRNSIAKYHYHEHYRPSKGELTDKEDIDDICRIEADAIILMGFALVENAISKLQRENGTRKNNSISIVKQYLKDEHVKMLVQQLLALDSENNTKVDLDLSKNLIGPEGVNSLQGLSCRSLVSLNLAENPIGDDGFTYLCDQLMHPNCTLRSLSLPEMSSFSQQAATALAEALHVNTSLRYLDLAKNRIDCKIAVKVCEALLINKTIAIVDLSKNNIGMVGSKKVLTLLEKNSASVNFRRLDLSINAIGSESKNLIEKFNKKNPQHQIICTSPEMITRSFNSVQLLVYPNRKALLKGEKDFRNQLNHHKARKDIKR